MGRLTFWVLLGLTLFAVSCNDVLASSGSDVGPSESECRPYIEKAINELKTGEPSDQDSVPSPETTSGEDTTNNEIDEDDDGVDSGEQPTDNDDNVDDSDNLETVEINDVESIEGVGEQSEELQSDQPASNDDDDDIDDDGVKNADDTDVDGDGVLNADDRDIDGDGALNEDDSDIDGDGLSNSQDEDIDGDGEANADDDDVDGDGVSNVHDEDIDGDGVKNAQDQDIDGDGVSNSQDEDIDGDGEANADDDDIDGDGVRNAQDEDVDGDGVNNSQDEDIDGDGVSNSQDEDVDGDGVTNAQDEDIDGDGEANADDDDVDGDGVSNVHDEDIDGDGIKNSQDEDIDGDGVKNAQDEDVDGDGVSNAQDEDVDGDGVSNVHDEDVDGDGVSNLHDEDIDGDGIKNAHDVDIDGDGVENAHDEDVDGDGVLNAHDKDVDGDGVLNAHDKDVDGDGVINDLDRDIDGDGKLNPHDEDIDGDGVLNHEDEDIDGDGVPNTHDEDSHENDGVEEGEVVKREKREVGAKPDGADETEEDEDDTKPEDELLWEGEIPENLRSRDHITELLLLNEDNAREKAVDNVAEIILRDIKRIYETAIKPLETLYKYRDLSNRHFGDPEIFSKPLILFMGPWSGGKSSILNYLNDNEYTPYSLRTGAEPSPAYFNILMWGNETEVLDGTQLAADYTFSGLQKFGEGLEDRLRGLKMPSKLLEKVNIVEIPGILEVRKQVSRVFPFNDACQWFIDRADIIFLVYDPAKLDVGPETEAILDQLKGREYQTRIILNKADTVKPEELLRVQSALIWNISPLMSSAQPPLVYTTSLWSHPYQDGAPARLLLAQERAFLRDLRTAIDKRIEHKIASARRFAVRVRNHAKMVDCYLNTFYNHKTLFGNKKRIADDIIDNPQNYHIYEGLSTLTNISRYDLPDPDVYRDFFRLNSLYEFKKLSETCTYFRGCPITKLDVAIAYDLPELAGKYKKMAEAALSNVDAKQQGSQSQAGQAQNIKNKS